MAQWYDGFKNRNVEEGNVWQVQAGGFHIVTEQSSRAGGHWVNWLRGDNVASTGGSKRISHTLPSEADLSKSVEWRCLFALNETTDEFFRFWLFSNGIDVNFNTAGTTGYFVLVTGTAVGSLFRLYRSDGGGVVAFFINTIWTPDTEEHELIITREVSGANRFWRVYLDGALMGGPTNEATYTSGLYYGINCDERDQVGEIIITS